MNPDQLKISGLISLLEKYKRTLGDVLLTAYNGKSLLPLCGVYISKAGSFTYMTEDPADDGPPDEEVKP